jgi:hypothetical protein
MGQPRRLPLAGFFYTRRRRGGIAGNRTTALYFQMMVTIVKNKLC